MGHDGQSAPASPNWLGRALPVVGPLAGTSLLGLAAAAGAAYIVQQLTEAGEPDRRSRHGFTPWEFGVPFEDVAFPAVDGALLRGWWLACPESRRVIIALHGYRGRRADLLGVSSALWRAGYNVLQFDFRGHGDSDGRRVTLGHAETQDLRSALAWVQRRAPGGWVGVLGYSMGGTVALLGAADELAIRAVATDGAFCRQEERIRATWRRRMHLPPTPFVELAERVVERRHGFRFRDVDALATVGRIAPRPLLLIHAADDTVVPVEDVHRLAAAAGAAAEVWVIPGVAHCCGYFADRAAYCARLVAFFDRTAAREVAPSVAVASA
ncbi:MAG: alpha/beta fold hydrolase [Chloroflexi bacterium]|nr:alpha/beta fold hydrolase [Chloroflexota bacterium]